jgi:CHAT domain-containing protein
MTYEDFDLLLERAPKGFRAQVLSSSAGQASVEFQLPFSDVELENFLLKLGRTTRVVRRIESTEMTTAKSFGAALFDAVFAGDVRACLRSAVDEARRENTRVRLRIRLADPVLADLPWEFLYNPAVNRFLALSVQTPVVRYIELPEVIQPIAVTPPIRVLVMISSPSDYPALDGEAEWKRLNESLADLISAGTISVERMDDATLSALQQRLRRSEYHIFHFIGHGEFDQTLQEGVLLLERANKRGHRVGSQYLGMLLHDHNTLRLAILNACEGARSSRQDPFAGSAQSLVQQGIPAVIAMQFEIADDVASTFAHEFYGALADGLPIDAAVTEARKAIFAGGREIEWATPVLYLRAPDGRIFDVAPAATTAKPDPPPPPAGSRKAAVLEPPPPAGTPRERAATLIRGAGRLLALGEYKEALKQLAEARPLDPDSVMLAQLTASAEEQRAVADTRELLKRRGDPTTIGAQGAKAETRRPRTTGRRKRPADGDESDLVE